MLKSPPAGRFVQTHGTPLHGTRVAPEKLVWAVGALAEGLGIRAAVAKVEGVVKGAIKIIARLTYRQRYEQSTGRDPWRCPHCRADTGVWRLWHPTYGVIYDEGQVIKRGTYTSTAQRAGP